MAAVWAHPVWASSMGDLLGCRGQSIFGVMREKREWFCVASCFGHRFKTFAFLLAMGRQGRRRFIQQHRLHAPALRELHVSRIWCFSERVKGLEFSPSNSGKRRGLLKLHARISGRGGWRSEGIGQCRVPAGLSTEIGRHPIQLPYDLSIQ